MVRGVNKRVIEVRDINNECFEKAIFFVNKSHSILPKGLLKQQAVNLANTITGRDYRRAKHNKFWCIISPLIKYGLAILFGVVLSKLVL